MVGSGGGPSPQTSAQPPKESSSAIELYNGVPVGEGSYKILEIPANLKSGIIGKGGHLINFIRQQSQSDIQIQNPPAGCHFATITIRGNIAKAEKMIQEQIEGLQKHGDSDAWESELVEVPQYLVALVVGPQGKKVHELMEKCGCLIKFCQKTEIWPDAVKGEQICRVKGPPSKIPYGCQLVREQVELARRYDKKKSDRKQHEQANRGIQDQQRPPPQFHSGAQMSPFPQQTQGGPPPFPQMGGGGPPPFPQMGGGGPPPFPQMGAGGPPGPSPFPQMGDQPAAFPQQGGMGGPSMAPAGPFPQHGNTGISSGLRGPFPQQWKPLPSGTGGQQSGHQSTGGW
jgi:hypothetical protein